MFQEDEKLININDVDIKKIVKGANRYYIAYLNGGFIKNTELHTNNMNVLANSNELLNYIKIWNKIESLFNEKEVS